MPYPTRLLLLSRAMQVENSGARDEDKDRARRSGEREGVFATVLLYCSLVDVGVLTARQVGVFSLRFCAVRYAVSVIGARGTFLPEISSRGRGKLEGCRREYNSRRRETTQSPLLYRSSRTPSCPRLSVPIAGNARVAPSRVRCHPIS